MKTLMLVGHVTEIAGPGFYLRDFLVSLPDYNSTVIFHPMIGSKLTNTKVSHFISGKVKKVVEVPKAKGFLPQLIKDTLITLKIIFSTSRTIDTYVGLNNFDTLPALLFKGWKIKQIIYYGSDYADQRFDNFILNFIYKLIEKIGLKLSSLTVSNTQRAAVRRIEYGLDKTKSLVIPNGVDMSLIPQDSKKPKYMFVYQGYLSHGITEILGVINQLTKEKVKTNLAILGFGPEQEKIKKFITAHKLEKIVYFFGRMESERVYPFLKKDCQIGIAKYENTQDWTKYCSPLKVKDYLACGLAVVMSDVPEVASDIVKFKLGKVYHDKQGLYLAMKEVATKPKLLSQYVTNSKCYIKDFDWQIMFNKYLKPRLT